MKNSKKNLYFFIFSFFLFAMNFKSDAYEIIQQGPIHEAFMTKELGALVVESVPLAPPPLVNESMPPQEDSRTLWISGYWAWSKEKNSHIWISGIWRKPPPSHAWIPGYWKRYTQGWVWIQGFWSHISEDDLNYSDHPPPIRLEDEVPEALSENSIWVPGHWLWNEENSKYYWLRGKWIDLSKKWTLVPAHYYWRPGGYVFIPNYWDWPANNRGTVYASIELTQKEKKGGLNYTPSKTVNPFNIITYYYPYYPNYLLLYMHHYIIHRDFWNDMPTPIWWRWQSWWSLTYRHQWSLWQWYTHTGYPAPYWLSEKEASLMPPPSEALLEIVQNRALPPFVTEKKVIDQVDMISILNKFKESKRGNLIAPILPSDLEKLKEFQKLAAESSKETTKNLDPSGTVIYENKDSAFDSDAPKKPDFTILENESEKSENYVEIPPYPESDSAEKMNRNLSLLIALNEQKVSPIPQPMRYYYYPDPLEHNFNPITTQPITNQPTTQSNQEKVYTDYPPNLLPQVQYCPTCPGQVLPPLPPPIVPSFRYKDTYKPPLPRAQQDEGFLMNRPQPQINPGPSVHNSRGFRQKDRDHNSSYP